MNTNEHEKRCMAYLDGEMTASEAAAFDDALTPAERDRLAAEMRLEAGLTQILEAEVKCPDDLWQGLRRQISQQGAAPLRPRRASHWPRLALLAAALLLVGLAGGWYLNATPARPEVAIHGVTPSDPEVFALRSATDAAPEAVEAYLEKHGIQLALADSLHQGPKPGEWGPIRLLGSCQGNCPYGSIVEVLFLCGDRPARLLVTKVGAPGAHMIAQAVDSGEVKATRRIGEYLAGLICEGDNMEVLNMLQEPPQQVT